MAQAKKSTKKEAVEAEILVEAAPIDTPTEVVEKVKNEITAKAGKRSAKAQREDEIKVSKQAKKTNSAKKEVADKKPTTPNSPRPKSDRAGKRYRAVLVNIDKTKTYPLTDALSLASKTSPTKFDATVELHINLGVDPKQADQNVRDSVKLPAGTGKTIRVAVLAEADESAKAKKAGADAVDADKIFAELDKEDINFDVLVATPQMMAKLGKYARLLGPRGLMPNPKSGTVTADVAAAVSDAKAGKVEYRVDQAGIVHLPIGKVSFEPAKLLQNAEAVLGSIRAAKPASLKGIYIKNIYVTTTMGPSIRIETANAL